MAAFVHSNAKSRRIRDIGVFAEIVRLFMGHRRKTVSSCVKLGRGKLAKIANWPEIIEECSINPGSRPGALRPEDYVEIAKLCSKDAEQTGVF